MIDARGYTCPMPVLLVRKEIQRSAPEELTVLVDNRYAVENIRRFAAASGYAVSEAREGADYCLTLKK